MDPPDVYTAEFRTVDGAELHYTACGEESDPTVVCVDGLSRVCRDFDPLAHELAGDFRVLCPDMPGRGLILPAVTILVVVSANPA